MAGLIQLSTNPPLRFAINAYGRFGELLTDFVPLWERFASILPGVEAEQFGSQGHGLWPPLAESTIRQKQHRGLPLDPLIRTGLLRDSFEVLTMSPDVFSFGTRVPYAKYHQGVDDAGNPTNYNGRPPQRKVIDLTVEDRRKLEAEIVGWVNDQAAAAFHEAA